MESTQDECSESRHFEGRVVNGEIHLGDGIVLCPPGEPSTDEVPDLGSQGLRCVGPPLETPAAREGRLEEFSGEP